MKQNLKIEIDVHGKIQIVEVKIEEINFNNQTFNIYSFHGSLSHADYHYIEQNNLVNVYTDNSGNDYWDMDFLFVKKEFEGLYELYSKEFGWGN